MSTTTKRTKQKWKWNELNMFHLLLVLFLFWLVIFYSHWTLKAAIKGKTAPTILISLWHNIFVLLLLMVVMMLILIQYSWIYSKVCKKYQFLLCFYCKKSVTIWNAFAIGNAACISNVVVTNFDKSTKQTCVNMSVCNLEHLAIICANGRNGKNANCWCFRCPKDNYRCWCFHAPVLSLWSQFIIKQLWLWLQHWNLHSDILDTEWLWCGFVITVIPLLLLLLVFPVFIWICAWFDNKLLWPQFAVTQSCWWLHPLTMHLFWLCGSPCIGFAIP